MKNLIVGCGNKPKTGCVNLDKFPLPGVDVVYDLDRCGRPIDSYNTHILGQLPFNDEEFDRIEAEDVLEHIEHFVEAVQELLRVLKIGGTLWVRGPDCNDPEQCWADPTHRRLFAKRTFDNFDPTTWDGKRYGHYFGKRTVNVVLVKSVNKGYEYTMTRSS